MTIGWIYSLIKKENKMERRIKDFTLRFKCNCGSTVTTNRKHFNCLYCKAVYNIQIFNSKKERNNDKLQDK